MPKLTKHKIRQLKKNYLKKFWDSKEFICTHDIHDAYISYLSGGIDRICKGDVVILLDSYVARGIVEWNQYLVSKQIIFTKNKHSRCEMRQAYFIKHFRPLSKSEEQIKDILE